MSLSHGRLRQRPQCEAGARWPLRLERRIRCAAGRRWQGRSAARRRSPAGRSSAAGTMPGISLQPHCRAARIERAGSSRAGPAYRDVAGARTGRRPAPPRPCGRRTSRSPGRAVSATTPRSWVIRMTAVPSSRCRSPIRSRICAWIVTSSAVVGSSAISTLGWQASAMAIIARWRMPPESWCGYSRARRSGSGMPTRRSISIGRAARGAPRSVLVEHGASRAIWRPMVISGLSEVIGSWKIIAISRPRMRRMAAASSVSRSTPPSFTLPATMRPGGSGTGASATAR